MRNHLTTTTIIYRNPFLCSIDGADPAAASPDAAGGGGAGGAAVAGGDPAAVASPPASADETTLLGGEAPAKPTADPANPKPDDKTGALAAVVKTPEEIAAEKATADAAKAAAEAVEVPEGTPFDLKAPEGFEGLDEAALAAAQPLLRQLGIKTNAAAQAAIDNFSKEVLPGMVQRAVAADRTALIQGFAEQKAAWLEATKADPELSGSPEKLQTTINTAIKFRDRFGGPEVTKLLNEFGLGNHPEVIRMFAKAGKAISEGAFHVSDVSAQRKGGAETRLYDAAFQPR